MSETQKRRMTIIPEDHSDDTNNIPVHRHHRRSQKSKMAYKKKHPVKYFLFGTKENRLRTAFSVALVLAVLIIVFVFPLIFQPFTNKSSSPDSICANNACSKKVARSGDTNFCPSHSAKCADCKCYIDTYATYCRDCIERQKTDSDNSPAN